MSPATTCVICRDTGYVTYTDENCSTTAYCDCDAGTMAYNRDDDFIKDANDKLSLDEDD